MKTKRNLIGTLAIVAFLSVSCQKDNLNDMNPEIPVQPIEGVPDQGLPPSPEQPIQGVPDQELPPSAEQPLPGIPDQELPPSAEQPLPDDAEKEPHN